MWLNYSQIYCAQSNLNQSEAVSSSGFSGSNDTTLPGFSVSSETYSFQAEVSRLLDTIINSLYTEKDIFLRELISNAADGLEKARFIAVSQPKYLEKLPQLEILVSTDKENKTLTIRDTGIGMTKKELITNLGTVAQSGTTNFLEAISNGTDVNLIGQFGVGFYSAFLVANNVTVISKSEADPKQHIWQSSATNSFTVMEDRRGPTIVRGTQVILYLRDDMLEFLEEEKIEKTILKYNQYVNFPIQLLKKPSEKDPKENVTQEREWVQINHMKPLWLRNKEDISPKEYEDFYKSLTHSFSGPLTYTHFVGEGEIEFRAIIFIPDREPYDWNSYFSSKQTALKLYARRVLVADSFHDLIPRWLSFIKGVVDSDDLPLKVDRESLSQSRVLRLITRKVVGKVLDLINKLASEDKQIRDQYKIQKEEAEKQGQDTPVGPPETNFTIFWKAFRKPLRIGCLDDHSNRERIAKLLRFRSSFTGPNDTISLEDYVKRMPESQKKIYFYSNDVYEAALTSPHMQIYKKKGYEVLILEDPISEPCFDRLRLYDSKSLVSIEKANAAFELTDDEKRLQKRLTKAYKPLLTLWKNSLKSHISNIRISMELVDAPAVITTPAYEHGAYSERVVRAQTFTSPYDERQKLRYLDLNPHHPFIQKVLKMAQDTPDDPQLQKLAQMTYDTAMLASGFVISNPSALSREVFKLIQSDIGLSKNEPIQEFVPPEDSGEDDSTTSAEDDKTLEDSDDIDSMFANAQENKLFDEAEEQKQDETSNEFSNLEADATTSSMESRFQESASEEVDFKDEL